MLQSEKKCCRCKTPFLPDDVPLRSRLCPGCWDFGRFRYRKSRDVVAKAAARIVHSAIRRGELVQLSYKFDAGIKCVDCGKPAQHWDHRDYSKPLDVEPCCASCNKLRGPAKNRVEANG